MYRFQKDQLCIDESLKILYEADKLTDVVIKITGPGKDQEIKAHMTIMTVHSDFFMKGVVGKKEKKEKEVGFTGYKVDIKSRSSPELVKNVLEAIYTGEIMASEIVYELEVDDLVKEGKAKTVKTTNAIETAAIIGWLGIKCFDGALERFASKATHDAEANVRFTEVFQHYYSKYLGTVLDRNEGMRSARLPVDIAGRQGARRVPSIRSRRPHIVPVISGKPRRTLRRRGDPISLLRREQPSVPERSRLTLRSRRPRLLAREEKTRSFRSRGPPTVPERSRLTPRSRRPRSLAREGKTRSRGPPMVPRAPSPIRSPSPEE
uniref:BTB domain-containing protein n=1 Tax=Pithovirus LCDPAC01 TaxID=2506600 RepID=A0A481YPA4_9VIRU|nr:MAG: uncharacterized protein LCDPAC01_01130 [Pithovirus LCDPAC01]